MTSVKAEKGDLIRVVTLDDGRGNPTAYNGEYELGDILEVEEGPDGDDIITTTCGALLYGHEYVIHRKVGEEDSETVDFPEDSEGLPYKQVLDAEPQDAVNRPNHYTQGKFEVIEVIEEITKGYSDGYVAYCVGNALKYLARAPFKHGEPSEDLAKAGAYIRFASEYLDTKSTQ